MNGPELKLLRTRQGWTQQDAAQRMGVTQAYLSMVERSIRPMSREFRENVMDILVVPATLLPLGDFERKEWTTEYLVDALSSLGYPGFAYCRSGSKSNPAQVLMEALDSEELDSRITEALPWIPLAYPDLNWEWLLLNAKVHDRQNRLAFVLALASQIAATKTDSQLESVLKERVRVLERSRLAVEDTLCKQSMTQAERNWLRSHRPHAATFWNLLTDLTPDQLTHAFA